MKKIKVFVLPSHQSKERTSGVDFVRVIQPMVKLNGYKDDEIEIETTIYDINKSTDWLEVAKTYDVIYFNYLNNPWGFAAMGSMARSHGVKMVMDVDDSLWNLRADNPAYNVYKKGSQQLSDFTAICNEVDYLTVTNQYLKHVAMNNTRKSADKVIVFPNYIDLELYNYRPEFKDNYEINLVHFGSTTHFTDLQNHEFIRGLDRIMKEYPNVIFTTVGAFIPEFRQKWGMRYKNPYGNSDIYKWVKDHFPKFMDDVDIMLVPLDDDIYNRCKSSIKWIEASSAKKTGVWQDIRQYREVIRNGENGFLAKKDTEWYNAIKKLIEDKEARRKLGEQAFKDVSDGWQIQNHLKEYADFFKVLTK